MYFVIATFQGVGSYLSINYRLEILQGHNTNHGKTHQHIIATYIGTCPF